MLFGLILLLIGFVPLYSTDGGYVPAGAWSKDVKMLGVIIPGVVKLPGEDISNQDCCDIDKSFSLADLRGMRACYARFCGKSFVGADLGCWELGKNPKLRTGSPTSVVASLGATTRRKATNLLEADLTDCCFFKANCEGCIFKEAFLPGARFKEACLAGAQFDGAILYEKTLLLPRYGEDGHELDIGRAKLKVANFQGSYGLTAKEKEDLWYRGGLVDLTKDQAAECREKGWERHDKQKEYLDFLLS